ncbi:MAG: NUDIX hydrolase [Faecalibacterium sp.]
MNDTHHETFLSREVIFEGRVFTTTRDIVRLENGKEAVREMTHHNGGACIVPYTADGEIYMVRQYRYPFGQELWELPAGKLEKGEDPFLAAQRELEEECGVTASDYFSLGEFYPTVGFCTEKIYMWVATGLTKTAMHLDDDEFLTPETFPLETAYKMVMAGEICDGKTVAGILKLHALVQEGKL